MPSNYAHYRFGVAMLAGMPKEARKPIARFRRLYDVGLHGPDLFFYYNPFFHTRTGKLGQKFHAQTGEAFFTRVCRGLRLEPTEAGSAYLYGVLCHYCLDSVCHPFIEQEVEKGPAAHVEIETEFDRFLLETDGKIPPHTQSLAAHLHLTPGEYGTVADFYPGTSAASVRQALKNMAFCARLLASPEGKRRALLQKSMGMMGDVSGMLMTTAPNPRCEALDMPLLELYNRAEARYPVLLAQIQAFMRKGAPLGQEFSARFD